MKRWRQIAGHDFYLAHISDNGWYRSLRHRRGNFKEGIICYNCGTWTTDAEWRKKVEDRFSIDALLQCGMFHVDLFGGAIWEGKADVANSPRLVRATRRS